MEQNKLRKILLYIFFFFFILPMFGKSGNILFFLIIIAVVYFLFKNKIAAIFGKSADNGKSKIIDLDKIKVKTSNIKENLNNISKINYKFMQNSKKIIGSIVVIVLLAWLFFASIVIVDAGETGVYSLFGKVKDEELRSGFHLVIPLAHVTKMSIRTEEYTMSIAQGEGRRADADAITSLTKEGLSVDLDLTVLYRLEEEKASDVYKNLGLTYDEKVIRPSIRTSIRDVIAQYEAKDIYSDKRGEVTAKIEESLKNELLNRGIAVESVLLRNVNLPANLSKAIQEKLQADQEAQKYDFILQKEAKEKQRKVIEAEGQRDAQKIINESLTTNYLYYQYISQLQTRQGTIYVPTSPDTGMPLFRNLGE